MPSFGESAERSSHQDRPGYPLPTHRAESGAIDTPAEHGGGPDGRHHARPDYQAPPVHVRHRAAGRRGKPAGLLQRRRREVGPVIAAPSRASDSVSVPMWHCTCTPRSPCDARSWASNSPLLLDGLGLPGRRARGQHQYGAARPAGAARRVPARDPPRASASGVVGYVARGRQRRCGPVGARSVGRELADDARGVIDAARRRQGPPTAVNPNVRASGLPRRPRFAADCGHAGRHALRSN